MDVPGHSGRTNTLVNRESSISSIAVRLFDVYIVHYMDVQPSTLHATRHNLPVTMARHSVLSVCTVNKQKRDLKSRRERIFMLRS